MDKIYLDLSLSCCAMIQYSSYLWKRREWKKHLVNELDRAFSREITIPRELHEELDKLILPRALKNELKFAVVSIGTRIRNWLSQFSHNPEESWLDFVDHVHWSQIGCINFTETYRSLYKSGNLPTTYDTWLTLCKYCIEECIIDIWQKLPAIERQLSSRNDNWQYLLPHYWQCRMENTLQDFNDNLTDSGAIDQYMINEFKEHSLESFLYFWNRLDEDQRKTAICNRIQSGNSELLLKHNWERFLDALMFTIRSYCIYGFEEDVMEIFDSKKMALSYLAKMFYWPYKNHAIMAMQELCSEGIVFWEVRTLSAFLNIMQSERACVDNDSKTRNVFCHMWRNSDRFKFRNNWQEQPIIDMIDNDDIESLKYVVKCEERLQERETLLEMILKYCRWKNELLKKISEELSQEKDVAEWFIKKGVDFQK